MSTLSDILSARMLITLAVVIAGGAAGYIMLHNVGEQRAPLKDAIGLSPSQLQQTKVVSADYSKYSDPTVRTIHQLFDQLRPLLKVQAESMAVGQLVARADGLDPLRDAAELNSTKAALTDDLAVVMVDCTVVPTVDEDGNFEVDQIDDHSVRVHAKCVDDQANTVPVMQSLATQSISPIVSNGAYKQLIAPSSASTAVLGTKRAGEIGIHWTLARTEPAGQLRIE